MEFLITISDSYSEPVLLLMYSVYRNMGEGHEFYFIHKNISKENQKRIREYAEQKCKAEVNFVQYSDERFSLLPLYGVWSEEIYYRLFAAHLLPDVNKVVYLDGDTLITGNLDKAWKDGTLNNYCLGAVANDIQQEHKLRLELPDNATYINSGVLFMNLHRIRSMYSLQDIWDSLIQLRSKLKFPDQDYINLVFQKEICLLDIQYNYMINVTERSKDYPRIRKYKICHFVLSKPWNDEFLFKTDLKYLWYLFESGKRMKAVALLYQHRKRRWKTKIKSFLKLR